MGHSLLVHSSSKTKLPFQALMSRKRLAHHIFNTFASHVSLICDITDSDTDCWAQNGSSHGHVFTTFEHWFLATRMRNREIKLKTVVCFIVYCFIHSYQCYTSSVQFIFKSLYSVICFLILLQQGKCKYCICNSKLSLYIKSFCYTSQIKSPPLP